MQATRLTQLSRRAAAALIALALIGGCALKPTEKPPATTEARAQQLYQSGHYAKAAQTWQQLASNASGDKQPSLLLQAGKAWARAGNSQQALKTLAAIPPDALAGHEADQRTLLMAQLELALQRPDAALATLNRLGERLSDETRLTARKLRGRALFKLGEPVNAVKTLTQSTGMPRNRAALAELRQVVWEGLKQTGQPLTARAQDVDATTAGWLSLGEIGRTAWQTPYQFKKHINAWRDNHPNHPANGAFVRHLLKQHAQSTSYPGRVAVLLPLTGAHADVAAAIRGGLLASRYARGDNQATAASPVIRFYDTKGSPAQAVAAYKKAIDNGAQAVIGPAQPDALKALVRAGLISVPTLSLTNIALNDKAPTPSTRERGSLDRFFSWGPSPEQPESSAPSKLYQIGFDPTDQARDAADRAVRDNRLRAVALAPDTRHGHDMVKAFGKELKALGGTLLESDYYAPEKTDAKTPIKQMLNLDRSERRARTLKNVLHRNLKFTPRRRRDVQLIFLIADNGKARLIRPQIRYHHGIHLPIYASSTIYTPGKRSEYDLDGVMFMDLPWLLSGDSRITQIRSEVKQLWPERYDMAARDYALGYDAWRLLPLTIHLDQPLASPIRGVTGVLSMGPGQRIQRHFAWARYQKNSIEKLAPATSAAARDRS